MNRKRNESTNRSLWIAFLAIVFLAACSGNPSLRKIEKESDNPKLAAAVLHRTDSILACGGLSDEEEGRMLLAKAKAQFFLNYMTQSFPPRLDSVITAAVQKLERHDSPKLAESYYWQGMISNLCYGKPVEGMVALENALLILPDDDPEFRARLYQQLSTVYEQLGNFDMAVRYMQQMVRLMDSRDDPVGQLVTHYDISTIFRQNGQKDSADYYLRLAIRERAKFNDKRFDIFNEVFGSYYLEQNDLPKAKYYLSHALMADGRMPDAQLGLARIAWMEHRPADTQRCLQRSVTLADSLYRADGSYRTPMVSFLRSLARFYSDTGAKDEELHARRRLDTVGTAQRPAAQRGLRAGARLPRMQTGTGKPAAEPPADDVRRHRRPAGRRICVPAGTALYPQVARTAGKAQAEDLPANARDREAQGTGEGILQDAGRPDHRRKAPLRIDRTGYGHDGRLGQGHAGTLYLLRTFHRSGHLRHLEREADGEAHHLLLSLEEGLQRCRDCPDHERLQRQHPHHALQHTPAETAGR